MGIGQTQHRKEHHHRYHHRDRRKHPGTQKLKSEGAATGPETTNRVGRQSSSEHGRNVAAVATTAEVPKAAQALPDTL